MVLKLDSIIYHGFLCRYKCLSKNHPTQKSEEEIVEREKKTKNNAANFNAMSAIS